MLNPMNPFHKLLGLCLFKLPHNQRRWQACLRQYLPILESAFKYNCAARLLVMKALRQISRKKIHAALHTLRTLSPVAYEGEPVEKALWAFLHGLGYMLLPFQLLPDICALHRCHHCRLSAGNPQTLAHHQRTMRRPCHVRRAPIHH